MGKRKVGALEKVDADLANLQNKVRRDPISYKDDFQNQYNQYISQRELFAQAPNAVTDATLVSLKELVDFVAHTAECYPQLTADFPQQLIDLLQEHHAQLEPELREKLVTSLVLLRRKSVINSSQLISALFPVLTTTESKTLRTLLLQKILLDLRNSNTKREDHRLNRTVQAELHELVRADRSSPKALWAVKIIRELWKRQIWTEKKPVQIMTECCLSDNPKVIGAGVRFFLGGDKEREEFQDESSDDEGPDLGRMKHQFGVNKKSKKQARVMNNAVTQAKRKEKRKNKPDALNFSAFHLVLDPQQFAQDLFEKHLQSSRSILDLELKLQILQLVTRIVGLHELTILPLYSYFLKYLTPRQTSVTSFLASLAQATHRLVPSENLEPLVQKIANEFVSEGSAGEVAAAGLNSIREICRRQPEAMTDTLLQDLVMYRKSKDKGVMMAARGLLSLYREVDASLLKRRDRGKDGAIGMQLGERQKPRYGEVKPGEIAGLEQLAETWDENANDEDDSKAWEIQDDDNSDGWIAVSSDEELEVGGNMTAGVDDDENDEKDQDDVEVDGLEADEEEDWEEEEDNGDEELEELDETDSDEELESDAGLESPLQKKPKLVMAVEADKENTPGTTASATRKTWQEIAATRILTPADHAKLRELSLKQSITSSLASKHQKHKPTPSAIQQRAAMRHLDEPLTREDIEAAASLGKKMSKEEKVALAKEGKGERNEHKSTRAIHQSRKVAAGKSTTNREKARRKNALMTLGKARSKNKRSLVEKRNILRAHVARGKKGGRRGNKS